MAQQQALGALQAVLADVVVETEEALAHLADDRLGADVLALDPRMGGGERVEGLVEKLPPRLRVLDLLELLHAFGVVDALGLQFGEFLGLQFINLPAQDGVGVLDDRLAEREHVERIGRVGRI